MQSVTASADLEWLRRGAGRAPLVVAHRGASGQAPENTLAAFRLAIQQGAPAVECDVHLTLDGVPVVIHDDRVDRTTTGTGEVATQRYDALRDLDAGTWFCAQFAGEHLPTLEEALAVCAGKARLIVELKRGGGEALVDAALAAINRAPGTDLAVISFGPEEVRHVARKRPDLALGFLIGRKHLQEHGAATAVGAAQNFGANFISPQYDATDETLVRLAVDAGLPVSVWTVDDPGRMRRLAAMGVNAITTNYPDVALDLFR
ncbi:MAG TPA: glycerophosphodiester phosphodiesterase family protein [Chloroflexota bacterium]|nr:glycerophosphodiester phosphodiesterase family protein [Chloroflexota bacterium]